MEPVATVLTAGGLTGVLLWCARRWPALAWVGLVPMFAALPTLSAPQALVSAAIAGVLTIVPMVADRTQRPLWALATFSSATSWGLAYGCANVILHDLARPWAAVVLPLATVAATLPMRSVGAPRWINNPIAASQQRWLPIVHVAGLGGDLAVTATLGALNAGLSLLWRTPQLDTDGALAGWAAVAAAMAALGYGAWRYGRAGRLADGAERVRMAAVVANVRAPEQAPITGLWALQSPEAADVPGALKRYAPHIEQAARAGAELVVLPECAVCVDENSRQEWLGGLAITAQSLQLAIVAPFFDVSALRNELAVIDARGRIVGSYEKQHPVPKLEPKRGAKRAPGPYFVSTRARTLPLSTVICADNDYGDLVPTVRRVGGVLSVPANDWPVFEHLHHRAAVWSAAISGAPVVRSTGHGISAVYDGAGRVLASQSSLEGPVVLIADVPLAPSLLQAPRREESPSAQRTANQSVTA